MSGTTGPGSAAVDDADLTTRWELLCAAAVTLFSFSGALIMQMPREDRRTLFIFPIFLSVVVGGSLAVFGFENFGARMIAAPVIIPVLLVLLARRAAPGWLLTVLSYVTLVGAVVCADLLLDASVFR
ncbi:MAG: hypothetical protein ABSC95_03760 [Acetobacteraceae bacterium]|jgi:hypothetical protein